MTRGEGQAAAADRSRGGWRWWRGPVWAIAVLSLLVLAASGFMWLRYEQFRDDVAESNVRVPGDVTSQDSLGSAAAGGALNVLVAVPGGDIDSLMLVHLSPSDHTASTLAVSGRVKLDQSTVGDLVQSGSITDLIGRLRNSGVPVDHVLLLDQSSIGSLADAIGGVRITNPTRATITGSSGSLSVADGIVTLHGGEAVTYLTGDAGRAMNGMSRDQRQARVLTAISHKLLEPSSLGALRAVGPAVKSYVDTDISPGQYSSELIQWGQTSRAVACATGSQTEISSGLARGFSQAGTVGTSSNGCTARTVSAPPFVPAVARLGSEPGAILGRTMAAAALMLAVSLIVLLLTSLTFARWRARRAGSEGDEGEPWAAPATDPAPRLLAEVTAHAAAPERTPVEEPEAQEDAAQEPEAEPEPVAVAAAPGAEVEATATPAQFDVPPPIPIGLPPTRQSDPERRKRRPSLPTRFKERRRQEPDPEPRSTAAGVSARRWRDGKELRNMHDRPPFLARVRHTISGMSTVGGYVLALGIALALGFLVAGLLAK